MKEDLLPSFLGTTAASGEAVLPVFEVLTLGTFLDGTSPPIHARGDPVALLVVQVHYDRHTKHTLPYTDSFVESICHGYHQV